MDIKTMIERFRLADPGDGTVAVYTDVSPAQAELIRSAKPEILAYLRREKEAAQAFQASLRDALTRIPGTDLICKEKKDASSPLLGELLSRYPDAAFALSVAAGQKDPNYEYACICHDACRKIVQGEDIPTVRAAFQKASDRLHAKYIWA